MGSICSKSTRNLKNIDIDDIEYFTLNGHNCYAKVVSIYDGDTCSVVFYWNGNLMKYKCRCDGYDSPEIKPRLNLHNREEHIIQAKEAKAKFSEYVGFGKNELIYISFGKFDKYGRVLGTFYKNINDFKHEKSINQQMINNGYGYVYNGGTKKI